MTLRNSKLLSLGCFCSKQGSPPTQKVCKKAYNPLAQITKRVTEMKNAGADISKIEK